MPRTLRVAQTRSDRPQPAAGDVLVALAELGRRLERIERAITDLRRSDQRPEEKEWYTTGELAEAMGVSVYTVTERWCNGGRIEAAKDPDTGKWRVPGSEFRRLVRGGSLRPRRR